MLAVPIALVNYNQMREDAVQQNLFTVNNNQIYDVAGRTQSPYIAKTLFMASPILNYTTRATVSFLFKSELFVNNSGKSVSALYVDAAKGNGYQQAYFNSTLAVTYTDTGYKRLKIKLVCTDASVYECFAEFNVMSLDPIRGGGKASTSGTIGIESYTDPEPGIDFTQPFAATTAHSGGTATVRMSRKGTERKITKPLVVVEGYDVSDIAPFLRDPYDYFAFIDDIDNEPFPYNLNSQLDDVAGYDLIFINYNRGTDLIERNAALFQEVLQWVNNQKATNGSAEQNVVLGISMGGLVARYGLADMTKRNTPTSTRLLISHDSPHRGANTPLSFQYLTRFLATLPAVGGFNVNNIPAIAQANRVLDEPATTQLLIWRATGRNTFAANAFLDNTYRPMVTFGNTGPKPTYRLIAMSNGSECGVNTLAPASNLLSASGRFIVRMPWILRPSRVSLDITLRALQDGGPSITIASIQARGRIRLLQGLILKANINLDLLNASSPANTLPWDGIPGGTQPIRDNLPDNVPTEFNQVVAFGRLLGQITAGVQLADRFCFVPIVSSLDITNITRPSLNAAYVAGVSPSNPSRMSNFIAQEPRTINSQTVNSITHPSFTARNAQWMFNEMEGVTPNALNCSASCQASGFSIIGNDLFCTSDIYNINASSPSVSVSWTSSPAGYVNISNRTPNGSSVDVSKISSGNVTLTATVSTCGTVVATVTKAIHVGGYGSSDYPVTGPSSTSCNYYVTYTTNQLPGATSYTWFYPSSWTYVDGQGTYMLTLIAKGTSGTYQVGVRVANACDAGGSYAIANTFLSGCSGAMTYDVSPNPATDDVTITPADQTTAATSSKTTPTASATIREVNIYDQQGMLKKHQKFNNQKQVTVNVSSLGTGIYFLEVVDTNHSERHQLSVLR